MDMYKICRCCLTDEAPLLTIYDGGTINKDDLAGMINKVTGIKPDPNDKLPDKACLSCIIEIKNFYAFKIKCENSHATLQQICLSEDIEHSYSSIKNPSQSEDATENKDVIIMAKYQVVALESEGSCEYSQSVNYENNIESIIPKCYVYKSIVPLVDETVPISNPPIYFQHSSQPVERITHLEDNTKKQSPNPETTETKYTKEYADSETNSCDSMEFISETPQENDDDTIHNTDDTAVEFSFINVSSPQFVPEEVNNLSLNNEDSNFDDLQRHSNTSDTIHSQTPSNMLPIDSNLKIHTGEKQYKLKICNSTFAEEITISNHEITHSFHRPYKCRYCDETFVQNSSRRSHEIFHTGSPYKCKYCQRGFINRKAKVKHEEAHNIE